MLIAHNAHQLAEFIEKAKSENRLISFVATMGNLHDGHLSLVSEAKKNNAFCVVSIFINPTQFGPNEDLSTYPRTLENDLSLLNDCSVDLVYTPTIQDIYPEGNENIPLLDVGSIGTILCGKGRPGHFEGVATVVDRLFSQVKPEIALLGAKDFQQVMVIKQMAMQNHPSVKIKALPTKREKSGLALSSRNGYLSSVEKAQAALIYKTLLWVTESLNSISLHDELCKKASLQLQTKGFVVEYLEVRNALNLAMPKETDRDLVVLIACHLGTTRLIDNIRFSLKY